MTSSHDVSPLLAFFERRVWAWLLLTVSLVTLAALGGMRHSIAVRSGDEPTFIAMAESLVHDGDLLFGEADRIRLERQREPAARAVILERTPKGIAYSKPVVYALFAAPWLALLGPNGMLLGNGVALAVALWIGWLWLRRRGSRERAFWALASWLGASVVPAYVVWQMSDALQVALALAGGALALWPGADGARQRWTMAIGGGLLGLLVAMRYPNAILLVGVLAALLLAGRARRFLGVLAAAVVLLAATMLLTQALTGAADPYTAVRTSVGNRSALPQGNDAASELAQGFRQAPASHHVTLRNRLEPRTSAYSLVYFWIGRHTGILFYFPAIIGLLWAALRSRERTSWALLAAAGLLALFYLLWTPRNYFGGGTFVGNRYILTAYALLLLALPKLPRPRVWLTAWLVAILAGGSALWSESRFEPRRGDSQGHAYAGLFRGLPYESTGHVIGTGTRDRYWASDFVRFVDPYARPKRFDFLLSSTMPAAGVEIATTGRSDRIHLLVDANAPEAVLVVSDWLHSRRVHLGPRPGGIQQLVEVRMSAPWRVHRFWWPASARVAYRVRLTRWKVLTRGAEPVTLRVRYLGGGALLRVFSGRLEEPPALQPAVKAGSSTALRLRVRNTSRAVWWHEGVAPVRIGYRVESLSTPREIVGSGRGELPTDVLSGGVVPVELDVNWPRRPGNYRLVIDGVVEHIAWFENRVGKPMYSGQVEVEAAAAGD